MLELLIREVELTLQIRQLGFKLVDLLLVLVFVLLDGNDPCSGRLDWSRLILILAIAASIGIRNVLLILALQLLTLIILLFIISFLLFKLPCFRIFLLGLFGSWFGTCALLCTTFNR